MQPRELVQAWVDAFNRADVDALARFYSEDATNHQVAEAPVVGRAAIRQMFAAGFASATMVCVVEHVFQDGEWAILEWRDPLGLRGCGFFQLGQAHVSASAGIAAALTVEFGLRRTTSWQGGQTMQIVPRIVPCLWFDDQAEQAAAFYTGIFPNSKIVKVARYGKAGHESHRRPAGSVMTVAFELDGKPFTALNGGPVFKFNEAISLQIMCETQEEVDHYWTRLSQGGDAAAQMCGWLKDKYGVSWQVVPRVLIDMVGDPDSAGSERAMTAMMQMKKLDIGALKRAYAGA